MSNPTLEATNEVTFVAANTGFMYWGPGDSYTILIDGRRSGLSRARGRGFLSIARQPHM